MEVRYSLLYYLATLAIIHAGSYTYALTHETPPSVILCLWYIVTMLCYWEMVRLNIEIFLSPTLSLKLMQTTYMPYDSAKLGTISTFSSPRVDSYLLITDYNSTWTNQ